jgi:predicted RNA-binding Zn ribbon-like protein
LTGYLDQLVEANWALAQDITQEAFLPVLRQHATRGQGLASEADAACARALLAIQSHDCVTNIEVGYHYMKEFLCLDFINSEQMDGFGRRSDRLHDTGWLAQFPPLWHVDLAPSIDTVGLEPFVTLRAALRSIVESVSAGNEVSAHDIACLNETLANAPTSKRVTMEADRFRAEEIPLSADHRWILGQIAVSALELLTQHDPKRLRICANPGCRWVFYDASHPGTRRWCTHTLCGNRDKVRRFRQRQATRQGEDLPSTHR